MLLTAFDGRSISSVQDRRSGPTIPPRSQFVMETHMAGGFGTAIGTGRASARLSGIAKNAWLSLRLLQTRVGRRGGVD